MSEILPFSNGDFDAGAIDFELWEAELEDTETIARLSHELGRLSFSDTVEFRPELVAKPEKPLDEQEQKYDEPQIAMYQEPKREQESYNYEEPYLLSDEMFDAAMGLIYFATGVPADELRK